MPGAAPHGWNATAAPSTASSSSSSNNMTSAIDLKRLRSKPAPPQSHQCQALSQQVSMNSQSSSLLAPTSTASAAAMPKHDLDTLVSPLTTMLHGTQISSQVDDLSSNSTSLTHQRSLDFAGRADLTIPSAASSSRQRQGRPEQEQHRPRQDSLSNPVNSHNQSLKESALSPDSQYHPRLPRSREESNTTLDAHVDSSLHHYPAAARSRFDSSTSSADSGASHSHMFESSGSATNSHPPPSPQTPRKIRNSSLPMGTSPSLSSSPNAGRQSPTSHRRPLKPIPPSSYPALLPGQPSLPPLSSKDSSHSHPNEMYESILPTSSSLRPSRQPSYETASTSPHPLSGSSVVASSPDQNLPTTLASPGKTRKDRGVLSPGSPTPHKKLVRKTSKGQLRNDTGSLAYAPSSAFSPSAPAPAHSRSLSLPRTSSRGSASTPTGGAGSGSGSEQDDSTHASISSHSHFFTQRPAWLDQDPAASTSMPPFPNASIRAKSRTGSLHQEHKVDVGLGPSPFAPSSLPSTSTLAQHYPQRDEAPVSTASQPRRKPSFYKRKRSQTATDVPAAEKLDSNGFPITSPMSEIVKSMPLHGRMSHDVLQPPGAPPKRNTSSSSGGGGFLSSITRKLSHSNIKDPSPTFEPVIVDSSPDYFTGACPQPPEKSHTHSIIHHSHHNSPKLGSSSTFRSWLHPFGGDHAKNDSKALPQLPLDGPDPMQPSNTGKSIYGDPFSAASSLSLPGFLHRSPRKDSLSSDKSEQSSKLPS